MPGKGKAELYSAPAGDLSGDGWQAITGPMEFRAAEQDRKIKSPEGMDATMFERIKAIWANAVARVLEKLGWQLRCDYINGPQTLPPPLSREGGTTGI